VYEELGKNQREYYTVCAAGNREIASGVTVVLFLPGPVASKQTSERRASSEYAVAHGKRDLTGPVTFFCCFVRSMSPRCSLKA
jgi:hypothetical protein